MSRMPILFRIASLCSGRCLPEKPWDIRPDFSGLSPWTGQVAYALLTRAPVAGRGKQAYLPDAPRLACVRPVASVHPEPGSNSPLLDMFVYFFSVFITAFLSRQVIALFTWVECDRRLLSCTTSLSIAIVVNVLALCFWKRRFRKALQSYKVFSKPPNFFVKIFVLTFQTWDSLCRCSRAVLKSECKVRNSRRYFQILEQLFLKKI